MNQITPKGPLGQKSNEDRESKERLAAVAEMPCVICHEYGLPQLSPTKVHHAIHGRYSMGQRAPDNMALPLCDGHHQGDFDTSKIALHRQPTAWKAAYGLDVDWLSWVEERLQAKGILKVGKPHD